MQLGSGARYRGTSMGLLQEAYAACSRCGHRTSAAARPQPVVRAAGAPAGSLLQEACTACRRCGRYRSTAPALSPARSLLCVLQGHAQGTCYRRPPVPAAGAVATGAPHQRCRRRAACDACYRGTRRGLLQEVPHPCSIRTTSGACAQHFLSPSHCLGFR